MNTQFDLEASVAAWRARFRAHEVISDAQIDELESHLRDSIADLNQSGLTHEESFLLARHRLGCESVAEEMEKADPTRLWATRAKWMFIGVLSYYALTSILTILGGVIQILVVLLLPSVNAARLVTYCGAFLSLGVFVWTVWHVANGHWQFTGIKRFAFMRRPWFLALCTAGVLALGNFVGLLQTMTIVRTLPSQSYVQLFWSLQWFGFAKPVLLLIILAFATDRAIKASES
ncbi:hypothetical protein ACXR0O_11180 [Verrucomicrobiota bacterium sgz303538]